MSISTRTWRVNWNSKLYDVNARYNEGIEKFVTIKQSKGAAKMVQVPEIGDRVWVCWNKHVRMEGIVVQGFISGIDHQLDTNNIGVNRSHEIPEYFAIIQVKSVIPRPIEHQGQRTWLLL